MVLLLVINAIFLSGLVFINLGVIFFIFLKVIPMLKAYEEIKPVAANYETLYVAYKTLHYEHQEMRQESLRATREQITVTQQLLGAVESCHASSQLLSSAITATRTLLGGKMATLIENVRLLKAYCRKDPEFCRRYDPALPPLILGSSGVEKQTAGSA